MIFVKMNDEINISQEAFETYEMIRRSGVTNMFDIGRVMKLSGGYLTRAEVINIMRNYSTLKDKYMPMK